jgi:hypothetical protein
MGTADDLERNYRVAFLRYLGGRDEASLSAGYELGRRALTEGVSLLDLAQIHHQVLVEVLRDAEGPNLDRLTSAASEFFLEVLATSDMVQRRLPAP